MGTLLPNKGKGTKGFTLLEVVVAGGILAAILASSLTLIINALGLEHTSRQHTQAVYLAQKYLDLAHSEIINSCNTSTITTSCPAPGTSPGGATPFCGDVGEFRVSVQQDLDFTTPSQNLQGSNQTLSQPDIRVDKYTKLTSTVTWSDKFGNPQSYDVSEYIYEK